VPGILYLKVRIEKTAKTRFFYWIDIVSVIRLYYLNSLF